MEKNKLGRIWDFSDGKISLDINDSELAHCIRNACLNFARGLMEACEYYEAEQWLVIANEIGRASKTVFEELNEEEYENDPLPFE